MIRFLILAVLFTIMLLPAGAQVIHIEPAQFARQYEDSASGLAYAGHGAFMELRSCRMEWFEVKFDSVVFDCSTGMLTIDAQVMSGRTGSRPISLSQMIVGGPIVGSSELFHSGRMQVRQRLTNDGHGRFRHTIGPIQQGDRIAFTTLDPESEDQYVASARSKVYNVGRLADCASEGGDGATLGQR